MVEEINFNKRKILRNMIMCNKCHDVIESTHVHDFKLCKCGAIAVDGGKEYLRRLYDREVDCTEMSVMEEKE